MEECIYCTVRHPKHIHEYMISPFETFIYTKVHSGQLWVRTNDVLEGAKINYCPICGRKLEKERAE